VCFAVFSICASDDLTARFLSLALTFLVLTAKPCLAQGPQEIWLDALTTQSDWGDLFTNKPTWAAVAQRLTVYETSNEYIERENDANLVKIWTDLSARGIKFAVALQPVEIDKDQKCGIGEGYSPQQDNAAGAEKLRRLGIVPSIIVLDEPLWFGHFDLTKCQFTTADLADRVGRNVNEYLGRFPDAIVGEIEPFPVVSNQSTWKADYAAFSARLGAAQGRPISFLQTDVDWSAPDHLSALVEAKTTASLLGQKFGIIYNGTPDAGSGEIWVGEAIKHFEDVESIGRLIPDQAIAATWDANPKKILPESDPGALSHVLAVYQLPRTRVLAQRVLGAVQGELLDSRDRPVANSPVSLLAIGSDPTKPVPVHLVEGAVPERARYAIIALRVNSECLCAGANDLIVGDFTYSEDRNLVETLSLSSLFKNHSFRPTGKVEFEPLAGNQTVGRLLVPQDQQAIYNSSQFSVKPGATFSFRAPIGSLSGQGLFGSVAVIWLDENHNGFTRTEIRIPLDATEIARVRTDQYGRFTLAQKRVRHLRPRVLRVFAADTSTIRGSVTELR
jgi:hypothetical protein